MAINLATSIFQYLNGRRNIADRINRKIGRFSVFYLGYLMVEHCNFSLIPQYYDSKYGTGHRVFTVIYKESKLRLFMCSLQMLYLLMWLIKCAYSGFNLVIYSNEYFSQSISNDDTDRYTTILLPQILKVCRSVIVEMITRDLWSPIADYRRRMNVLVFSFTLNSFSQRLYCLMRRQKPEISRPSIVRNLLHGDSNSNFCEIIMFRKFLFSLKLSPKEYFLYYFLNRPAPEQLMKEYPVLREMSLQDILEFDLMAIRFDKGLWCSTKAYKTLVRATIVGLVVIVIESILVSRLPIYLIEIYSDQAGYFKGNILVYCIKRIDMLLIVFFNICTVTDSFVLICRSILLSDRLSIYNIQLINFIKHLNTLTNNTKNINNYHERSHYTIYEDRTEKSYYRTPKTKKNCYMKYNGDPMLIGHCRRFSPSVSTQMVTQQSLDARCIRMVMILHQLLFEFKLWRELLTDRTDIDVLMSLCSYTWVLSTWLVAFKCETCKTKWPLILFAIMGNYYLANIILQLFFLVRVSKKVSL